LAVDGGGASIGRLLVHLVGRDHSLSLNEDIDFPRNPFDLNDLVQFWATVFWRAMRISTWCTIGIILCWGRPPLLVLVVAGHAGSAWHMTALWFIRAGTATAVWFGILMNSICWRLAQSRLCLLSSAGTSS
jgi:hypothetical protein